MTAHRQALKDELAKISLKDKSVIDWGAGSKPAERYINSEGCKFFTIDKNDYNKHDLIADITETIDIDKQFDVAFCLEVIEHVESVEGLLSNIWEYLKQDGVLYMSAPFQFEIHAEEDYWRFTEHGLKLLLEPYFKDIEIIPIDGLSGYFVKAVK